MKPLHARAIPAEELLRSRRDDDRIDGLYARAGGVSVRDVHCVKRPGWPGMPGHPSPRRSPKGEIALFIVPAVGAFPTFWKFPSRDRRASTRRGRWAAVPMTPRVRFRRQLSVRVRPADDETPSRSTSGHERHQNQVLLDGSHVDPLRSPSPRRLLLQCYDPEVERMVVPASPEGGR
jgi:hypothetical protein